MSFGCEPIRVQQPGEILQPVDEPRPCRRIQLRSHGVDRLVAHRGDGAPPRPRREHLGRLRVERQIRVGEDDDLGVSLNNGFRANLADVTRQVAKDVYATREVDQLTVKANGTRGEWLVWLRSVKLLVH